MVEKMKIALVSREYPPSRRQGGIATYVKETAVYLVEKGHTVHVVAASDDIRAGADYIDQGVHVIRLPGADFFLAEKSSFGNKLYSRWRSIVNHRSYRCSVAACLDHLIREHGVELVEFAEYGNESLVWAEKERTVPWIVRLHGSTYLDTGAGDKAKIFRSPLNWYFGKREMLALRQASEVTSCSEALANLQGQMAGISKEEIHVIPNSIAFSKMAYSRPLQSLSSEKTCSVFCAHSKIHVFSAGTVTEGKGYGELVEAIRLLRSEGMDISLTIAGRWGKLGRQLHDKATSNYAYRGWLRLLGTVPRNELPQFYAEAEVVVFPSWWESLGIVLLEAMAAGGLTIGSTSGGMAEVITDGETGFLVKPKCVDLLAAKIKEVLGLSLENKSKIRAAAMAAIRDNFDTQIVLAKQVEFYSRVITKFQGNNAKGYVDHA